MIYENAAEAWVLARTPDAKLNAKRVSSWHQLHRIASPRPPRNAQPPNHLQSPALHLRFVVPGA